MIKHRQNELIRNLSAIGYRFRSFTLTEEGDHSADDASWNYKDIIHLEHVHGNVDAYPSYVSDKVLATIYHQRILGFRLPLTLINYISEPGYQTYHTSFFFFILIVETHFEQIAPLKTRVVTEYAVGAPRLLLKLFFPLFRWSIRRNFDELTAADLAMRERRGQLRRWGYGFAKEGAERGFDECSRLDRQNVIPAPGRCPSHSARVPLATVRREGVVRIGESDHYGLQLAVRNGSLEIYPRLCLHEGGCLDVARPPAAGRIECPWHGLPTSPIVAFPLDGTSHASSTRWHRFDLQPDELFIHFRDTGGTD